ncbi:MAG: SCP2 sterol-binding domain-containing protein [Haliea sp.]|nr:SCP2 sterol-binding domain-containing protein [Haliea sp.]
MAAGLDPTLTTAALAALEAALNSALALDPAGQQQLGRLAGSTFAIECTAPKVNVYLQPAADKTRLLGYYDGPVTTRVRGAAADFAELAGASDPAAALINGNVALQGDSAPLIELQRIIGQLDLDWEAPLVTVLGDVAGHQLAEFLRSSFNAGNAVSGSLRRQLDEFIHEEARLTPPRLEVEDFYTDLQSLQQRVDRLQSRLDRLRKRMQASHT